MRKRILTLAVLCVVRCSTQPPSVQCLTDPGIDNRLNWESEHASVAEGTALLQSPTGVDVAQIRQVVNGLKPHTSYELSVRARAINTPSAQLSVDLYRDDGYDSPDQELVVPPDQIDATYRTFRRVINTGSFAGPPYLRIFTFSSVPIEVDAVGLVEVK